MRYTAISIYNMSIRVDHVTSAAKLALLEIGKSAKGDELWTCAITTNAAKAGDKWLHVKEMDGKPIDGWLAIIHLGMIYCKLTDTGIEPPPSVDDVKKIISATVTYLTNDGRTMQKTLYPLYVFQCDVI